MLRRLAPAPLAASLLSAALLLTACSSGGEGTARAAADRPTSGSASASATPTVTTTAPAAPLAQLPRGGRSIFPKHVVVAYYGTAGSGALGVLGETGPERAAKRTIQAAMPFQPASGRPVLPAFELITTVAASGPGPDGLYSTSLPLEEVMRYVKVAAQNKMLVILDFQPGRASFLDQVKRYEQALLEPNVGVALDPEWKLTATQKPLRQIGTSTAKPLNDVSSYLANLTLKNRLPEKIFMIHQFKSYQLPDREKIVDRPGLATVLHVDGFGAQGSKKETYGILHSRDKQFVNGFKLFYDEDTDLMTPAEAMAVTPRPELITYQ
ncbi:MAG: hypothetical protein JWO60_288 [Frankiales bacterium]|nr:hypothetical protein [Frankiales bacterium]